MGMLTRSAHCCVARSKMTSFCESVVMAAMYFPSGDQRGEKSCAACGNGETFRVCTSTIAMPAPEGLTFGSPPSFRVSTIDLPSGDQLGSKPTGALGTKSY